MTQLAAKTLKGWTIPTTKKNVENWKSSKKKKMRVQTQKQRQLLSNLC